MRFIRDIIFEKRAAKPPQASDWFGEDDSQPTGAAEAVEPVPPAPEPAAKSPAFLLPESTRIAEAPVPEVAAQPRTEPLAEASEQAISAMFRNVTIADAGYEDEAEPEEVAVFSPQYLRATPMPQSVAAKVPNAFEHLSDDDGFDDFDQLGENDDLHISDEPPAPQVPVSAFGRPMRPDPKPVEIRPIEPELRKPAADLGYRPQEEARLRAALTAAATEAPQAASISPLPLRADPPRVRSVAEMAFAAPPPPPEPEPTAVEPAGLAQFQVPPPAAGRGLNKGRVKTRLLGFNPDSIGMADPFEKAEAQPTPAFAVAWLVVVAGPGRGTSFALHDGVSKIGRGDDQTVSLNFGDNSISRENHVAVAYDAETNAFYIGQSGRANIVRLNNKPLLSTEELRSGDQIRVGETTLRFVALCGADFSWSETQRAEARNA